MKSNLKSEYGTQHKHPAASGNVRIEKVQVESTISVNDGNQGCNEHYYERFVRISENKKDDNAEKNRQFLRTLVMSDAVNTPRFKSRYTNRV